MNFDLTEEQQLLKDSVTRLLADRYGFESRKGFQASADGWSRELWRQYAELGLLGVPQYAQRRASSDLAHPVACHYPNTKPHRFPCEL